MSKFQDMCAKFGLSEDDTELRQIAFPIFLARRETNASKRAYWVGVAAGLRNAKKIKDIKGLAAELGPLEVEALGKAE